MESFELHVDQIFSDNMILPAGKSFQISGVGRAGSTVKVKIASDIKRAIVKRDGRWICRFDPVTDTRSSFEVQIADDREQILLKKVRFGRVILMAGQSNVGFRMAQDQDFETEVNHFTLNNIAYYNVPQPAFYFQNGQVEVYQSKTTHWHQLKATNLGHISAMAFYAVKRMTEEDPQLPIGVVCCTKEGALAATWLSKSTLTSQPQLMDEIVRPFEKQLQNKPNREFEEEVKLYRQKVQRHNRRMYKFMKDNPSVPLGMALNIVGQTPWPPPVTPDSYLKPGTLFKAMVLKIKNYSFDQVVWYQGETDIETRHLYDVLLREIINDWRRVFQDYSLPFHIIQLPKYANVLRNAWAEIRQQMLKVSQTLAAVHLVSITDTGELYNPHPVTKRIAGTRLGKILAGTTYSSTPVFNRIIKDKNQVHLKFKGVQHIHATQNCHIEGLVNGVWQSIPAKIKDDQVVVEFPNGTMQARYGYSNAPILTLYNEQNDPIAPFLINLDEGNLI
ncbi:sialate O-acetylesterase [Pediococcus pentosaceus]|uniref:sialate O-acetylesterase n=1 Tax=Pediococcus pentosaceus TaxID=1255 RepID=UPI001E52F87C|nr:sialate O-acetylesterase [Pediococcus pentosaceus]MCD5257164.1 sialate O-acetylesterase [Pediococcus pentosaceus]